MKSGMWRRMLSRLTSPLFPPPPPPLPLPPPLVPLVGEGLDGVVVVSSPTLGVVAEEMRLFFVMKLEVRLEALVVPSSSEPSSSFSHIVIHKILHVKMIQYDENEIILELG